MAQPMLKIQKDTNSAWHDYTEYVEELSPSRNDLDADGSGRDVQTGLMKRTRIASKMKFDVKFATLEEDVHKQLLVDISPVFFNVKAINPYTGSEGTFTVYVSSVPMGAQRYRKDTGKPYYTGMSISLTQQ